MVVKGISPAEDPVRYVPMRERLIDVLLLDEA